MNSGNGGTYKQRADDYATSHFYEFVCKKEFVLSVELYCE